MQYEKRGGMITSFMICCWGPKLYLQHPLNKDLENESLDMKTFSHFHNINKQQRTFLEEKNVKLKAIV